MPRPRASGSTHRHAVAVVSASRTLQRHATPLRDPKARPNCRGKGTTILLANPQKRPMDRHSQTSHACVWCGLAYPDVRRRSSLDFPGALQRRIHQFNPFFLFQFSFLFDGVHVVLYRVGCLPSRRRYVGTSGYWGGGPRPPWLPPSQRTRLWFANSPSPFPFPLPGWRAGRAARQR